MKAICSVLGDLGLSTVVLLMMEEVAVKVFHVQLERALEVLTQNVKYYGTFAIEV